MIGFIILTDDERRALVTALRNAAIEIEQDSITEAATQLGVFVGAAYKILSDRAAGFGININDLIRVRVEGSLAETIKSFFVK